MSQSILCKRLVEIKRYYLYLSNVCIVYALNKRNRLTPTIAENNAKTVAQNI